MSSKILVCSPQYLRLRYIVTALCQAADEENDAGTVVWGSCNHFFLEARRLRQWDSQVVMIDQKRQNFSTK